MFFSFILAERSYFLYQPRNDLEALPVHTARDLFDLDTGQAFVQQDDWLMISAKIHVIFHRAAQIKRQFELNLEDPSLWLNYWNVDRVLTTFARTMLTLPSEKIDELIESASPTILEIVLVFMQVQCCSALVVLHGSFASTFPLARTRCLGAVVGAACVLPLISKVDARYLLPLEVCSKS